MEVSMFLSEFSVQSVLDDPQTLSLDRDTALWILEKMKKNCVFIKDDNFQEYIEYVKEDDDDFFEDVPDENIERYFKNILLRINFCGDVYWFDRNFCNGRG
jgi:uncharacterized protein with PIN domain